MPFTFGSVCSGIEAASVAWHPLGWRAAWLAEIEPFPSAVLAHHYPDVPNLGDMTHLPEQIVMGEVVAPDLFCGGTPCQAFSVAGLRKSLDDARGNLSLTFCEIANAIDISRAHDGLNPCIVFWENVPGVLNTADNAFGCFLAGLAGEDDPLVPAGGKWPNAGCVFGPQRTVAWRVLDAQYFGVAQRRRRVFVVASARTDIDPVTVLFEFDGVRRDSAPSREAREGTAASAARSVALRGRDGGATAELGDDVQNCLRASAGGGDKPHVITMAHGQGGAEIGFDRGPTLTCNHEAPIAAYVAHTLRGEGFDASEDGTGRGTPLVPVAFAENSRHELRLEGGDGSRTGAISTGGGKPGQDVPCIAFNWNAQPDQVRFDEHTNATLTRSQEPAVAVREISQTLTSNYGKQVDSSDTGLGPNVVFPAMQVRRLTPTECERLQGFPDDYTLIPWKAHQVWAKKKKGTHVGGKSFEEWLIETTGRGLRQPTTQDCPDGPRYKALGNSWAVPVVRWIGWRIAAQVFGDLA